MSTDDDSTTEPTFTRAQMAKMVNAQVREKVAAALSEYGDLEALKSKAAEADKNQTQLDKMQEQLTALTTRAEKAEATTLRAAVAEELGLTAKEARKLSGKTREELLADGREMIEDFGIDIEARKKGKATDSAGKDGDDGNDDGESGKGTTDTQQQDSEQRPPARAPRTPRETLRSGTPGTQREPESTNPMDLVKSIPRF